MDNSNALFRHVMDTYLNKYMLSRNLQIELYVADSEIDIFKMSFKRAHEWQPDFLAIWNLNYDIPKIMEACGRAKIDPKYLFSDPSLPNNLKKFKYLPGPTKKTTASGKVIPINPAAQWHTVVAPASFYVIDAMCSYKHIRIGRQEEPHYSLDAILSKELGERKLRFDAAEGQIGLNWHKYMQKHYKIEYMTYAAFDVIGMLELDEKTKDLSLTLPTFAGTSDFSIFYSQPKRISDVMHHFCLERNKVIATVGRLDDIEDDDGNETLLNGWIKTLAADYTVRSGLTCIKEDPTLVTNIRAHVSDNDCVSAYPSATQALNVSKETTVTELLNVEGIPREAWMLQNINLLSGHVNAMEYCINMFNMPTPLQLLAEMNKI
jgi:hypothetical protein